MDTSRPLRTVLAQLYGNVFMDAKALKLSCTSCCTDLRPASPPLCGTTPKTHMARLHQSIHQFIIHLTPLLDIQPCGRQLLKVKLPRSASSPYINLGNFLKLDKRVKTRIRPTKHVSFQDGYEAPLFKFFVPFPLDI